MQGIKTVKDLLILLTHTEHMFHNMHRSKNNFLNERKYAPKGKEEGMRQYCRQSEARRENCKSRVKQKKIIQNG